MHLPLLYAGPHDIPKNFVLCFFRTSIWHPNDIMLYTDMLNPPYTAPTLNIHLNILVSALREIQIKSDNCVSNSLVKFSYYQVP